MAFKLAKLGFGSIGKRLQEMGLNLKRDIWAWLTPEQWPHTNLHKVHNKVSARSYPSWLRCGSRTPLDFLVTAATTGEWEGKQIGVHQGRTCCSLCGSRGELGGYPWATSPWEHLLVECDIAYDLVAAQPRVAWAARICQRTSVAVGLHLASGATVSSIVFLLGHIQKGI